MKLKFRILDIPAVDPFIPGASYNIPMLNMASVKPHLWFLWSKDDLKARLAAGYILYKLKKVG